MELLERSVFNRKSVNYRSIILNNKFRKHIYYTFGLQKNWKMRKGK